jgi:hypothetical protein
MNTLATMTQRKRRTAGLVSRKGVWHIDKVLFGKRRAAGLRAVKRGSIPRRLQAATLRNSTAHNAGRQTVSHGAVD